MRARERLSKPIMDMKHDLIWLHKRAKRCVRWVYFCLCGVLMYG